MSRTPYFDEYEQTRLRRRTESTNNISIGTGLQGVVNLRVNNTGFDHIVPLMSYSSGGNGTTTPIPIHYRLVKIYNDNNQLIDVHLEFITSPSAEWQRQECVSRYE